MIDCYFPPYSPFSWFLVDTETHQMNTDNIFTEDNTGQIRLLKVYSLFSYLCRLGPYDIVVNFKLKIKSQISWKNPPYVKRNCSL